MSSPPEGVLQMDWSCISPCVKRLLVASFLSFSVLSLSHFSWAGEPCRPPPASAERCGPAGPGARASPAPDMGRCAEPAPPPPPSSPPRGAHRGRLGTCRAQGPDWFWRKRKKRKKKKPCFQRRARHPCGTSLPLRGPPSNSTPGKF